MGGGPLRPRCDLALLGAASVAGRTSLSTARSFVVALHAHAVRKGWHISMLSERGIGNWTMTIAGSCRGNGPHSGCIFRT